MRKITGFISRNSSTLLAIACLAAYFIALQFISRTFYDPDSYFHAAVTNFIRTLGLKFDFHWAQFSVFKDFYSDKDLLFHVLSVPFFWFTNNLVLAGKYATIFFNITFLIVYAFILRKYLPDFLAACMLFLPAASSLFCAYFMQFRSLTLSNILVVLAIYFIINRRFIGIFIVSSLYTLSHISFFMLIPFVIICEGIRFAVNKEFSLRNVYCVLIGILAGVFLHPNFPNNLLSFHLNAVLVPLYTTTRLNMDFGSEFNSPPSSFAFINNFFIFFTVNFVLWVALFTKKKWSFSTLAWLACSNIYICLAFFSNRYWYPAHVLFFIFFASCLKDLIEEIPQKMLLRKSAAFIGLYFIAAAIIFPINLKQIKEYTFFFNANNLHYENAGLWMKRYVPAGETIYHASWSDAPAFLCMNPKNNYLNFLDPIYMFYRYPKIFQTCQDLIWGKVERPYEPLRNILKVNYGYTRKEAPLYFQVSGDKQHYKIVFEDGIGIIFKLI